MQPSVTAMGWAGRLRFRLGALPFLFGTKEPCEGFRSLGRGAPEP
jgi:hypothetical protein